MLQSYFLLLLRNLYSSSLSVMFVLESPAGKTPMSELSFSNLGCGVLQMPCHITSKLSGKV